MRTAGWLRQPCVTPSMVRMIWYISTRSLPSRASSRMRADSAKSGTGRKVCIPVEDTSREVGDVSGPREFDPVRLGHAECDAWVAYYRRDWRTVLTSAVRLVRWGFGMSWPRTARGAWLVLRANQAWGPYPDNDPDRARRLMRGFYALVVRDGGLSLDPERAAHLEVEWWRVHRAHQRRN